MAHRPQLGTHHALKLPHHGSPEAFHTALHTRNKSRRAWLVTPYNSSRLPGITDLDGLPRLLKHEPSVHLTALPASRSLQRPVEDPGVVRLDQLKVRTGKARSGVAFADRAVCVGSEQEPGCFDPVWVVAFDSEGLVRGRWRGSVAVEVLPAAQQKSKKRNSGNRPDTP